MSWRRGGRKKTFTPASHIFWREWCVAPRCSRLSPAVASQGRSSRVQQPQLPYWDLHMPHNQALEATWSQQPEQPWHDWAVVHNLCHVPVQVYFWGFNFFPVYYWMKSYLSVHCPRTFSCQLPSTAIFLAHNSVFTFFRKGWTYPGIAVNSFKKDLYRQGHTLWETS